LIPPFANPGAIDVLSIIAHSSVLFKMYAIHVI